ncbi:MAG: DUF3833 family protein [Hyphomonas sp.]|nr:DUF3833 family protein [Hyphomonas sp.]
MTVSAAMEVAIRCLGGHKRWRGCVRGLFGLWSREFEIVSAGMFASGALTFLERMTFSDGAVAEREWKISETESGLDLKASKIKLVRSGVLQGGWLVFEYSLRLGAFSCRYVDRFRPAENGQVQNRGVARIMGIPVLRIEAAATTRTSAEGGRTIGTGTTVAALT